ncbi:unnamed protein product [Thlaspi arvense]|uniref:Uncharacterized protein n=1 Tax=Thlaspi arvense TaxID=13288 RepID=A0AAU9S2K5_THLAR|nr:unnamed protein product [Thlaspi arvense]
MGLSMGFEALLRTEFPSLSFTLLQSSDPLPSRKSRGPLVVVCGGPLVPSSPNPPYPPDFGSVGVVSSPLMFSRGSASTPLKLYEGNPYSLTLKKVFSASVTLLQVILDSDILTIALLLGTDLNEFAGILRDPF